jgi:hypothetical protein
MKGPSLNVFAWTVGGVLAAVLLPILAQYAGPGLATAGPGVPPWLKQAVMLFLFSIVAALISLAAWMSANPGRPEPEWFTAFLIGFGWEAAIEKLTMS